VVARRGVGVGAHGLQTPLHLAANAAQTMLQQRRRTTSNGSSTSRSRAKSFTVSLQPRTSGVLEASKAAWAGVSSPNSCSTESIRPRAPNARGAFADSSGGGAGEGNGASASAAKAASPGLRSGTLTASSGAARGGVSAPLSPRGSACAGAPPRSRLLRPRLLRSRLLLRLAPRSAAGLPPDHCRGRTCRGRTSKAPASKEPQESGEPADPRPLPGGVGAAGRAMAGSGANATCGEPGSGAAVTAVARGNGRDNLADEAMRLRATLWRSKRDRLPP
jgi:hypothetical protein